ncbi:MAG: AMIN-like domain-containing (lipo)protein [Candidatus Dormibacteraceae bacterium]
MTNENFRRELGHVFDEMTGPPSGALPDRVRSSLANAPEQNGPYWIAGVAAAVIAVVVIGVLFVANPLNHQPNRTVPGAGASPTPSASVSPSPSPTSQTTPPDSTLPAFTCNPTGFVAKPTTPASPPVAYVDMIRTGTHAGYDRITIEFQNGSPASGDITPQSNATFTQGASGQQVSLSGTAGILVTMKGADEHTDYNGSVDFKTGYPVLLEARQVQDFEGTVQWGLGLSKPACYRAFFLTNPTRWVIDIQTP